MVWEPQIMMLCQPVVITTLRWLAHVAICWRADMGQKEACCAVVGHPTCAHVTALWGAPLASIHCVWLHLTVVAPRRLATRPEEWLAEGAWRGMMQEAVWDEDGDMLMLRPRPAVWCPPDAAKGGFRRAPHTVSCWARGLLSIERAA